MYIYSTKSRARVVHRPGCRYLAAVKPENRASFPSTRQAARAGFRACRCCNPLLRAYRSEEAALQETCRCCSIHMELNRMGELHIWTLYSKWILAASMTGDGLELYHKNEQHREESAPIFKGYHRQRDAREKSITAYLEYIDRHDAFRLRHPVQLPKPVREPPRKGTRRYRSAMAKEKRRQHHESVQRVYALLDTLSAHA